MLKKSMHVEDAFTTALQQIHLAFSRLESAEKYLKNIPGTESLLKDIVSAQETVDWLYERTIRQIDAVDDKLLIAYYDDHARFPREPWPSIDAVKPICKCKLCEMYRAYYGED